MKSDKTIDEAIQEFKKYCELNGDFDELDFKEAIFDHALTVAERLIGEDETYEGVQMVWAIEHRNQLRAELRTAFRKEYRRSNE